MKKIETPVLLLTGYLGSGKTTLLNRILSNRKGIRFAVIVNDIGEVNIDASLIQKGGIVGQDDSGDLVALQNGCICCTLKGDLMKQIVELLATRKFDYIVIEASGICEPAPIAQTICAMEDMISPRAKVAIVPKLDCIVTVVDALRMQSEFSCGKSLQKKNIGEEDIENLIIEQIEFCDIILLNKIDEVSPEEAGRIKAVVRAIQPRAEIIECNYADVDLDKLINTHKFDFEKVATSATWVQEIEKHTEEEDEHHHDHHEHHDHEHEDHEHEHEEHNHEHHHHHHHHDHEEGEAEEYGIGTFVYFRRRPFNFEKFDNYVNERWPKSVIRSKGVLYFSHNRDMSLIFEQAGVQKQLKESGLWYASAPEEELRQILAADPSIMRDWDEIYGDRMVKLVFIGQHLDREGITADLDKCLEEK